MSLSMSRFISASRTLPNPYSTSLTFHPTSHSSLFLKNKASASYSHHGSISCARRNFVVRSNLTPPPGVPLPSGPPSGSMRNWIVGIVLTFVLPFITHKWGPLIVLKNKVDTVVDTAEYIMETIEDVAERVDKVIDNITDELPENSRLRKTMEAVDGVVEGLAKSAHLANDIIDKVEEVEDKLESLIIQEEVKEKEEVSKQVEGKDRVSTTSVVSKQVESKL
ncbi:uncharacterized protein LOC112509920 [Cynara cardunculus var. scolymus]|uniref:Uncharacterized protein n=1 Tax=Cynara cardunculus var. scolymus TaxID=59895 RepID=A0A103YD08_CYNCS|nr:uncharacterized protein LOC112509920 [Cynara cardunculus var. scolymus]KVI06829.1 hypothetical protein Ccrd_014817 [Cynara cardunculus var. scolymus]